MFDEAPAQQAHERRPLLKTEAAATDFQWRVYPNPFTNKINVEIRSAGARLLEVTDILGRRLYRGEVAGPRTVEVELDGAQGGVYFIKVLDERGRVLGVEKVVRR